MQLDQVYRELEKHQGKFFTLYEGKLLVADEEQKIRNKAGECAIKKIPDMDGYFSWRAQITQALEEMSAEPKPEPEVAEEVYADGIEDAPVQKSDGFLSKLKGLWKK